MKSPIAFTLLLVICTAFVDATTPAPTKNKRFHVEISRPLNWYSAYMACRANGTGLATIMSVEESNYIKEEINKTQIYLGSNKAFFVGGTDFVNEGFWYWMTSGKAVGGFLDWGQNQPETYMGNEDCMVVKGGSNVWYWEATNCYDMHYYICEY